MVSHCWIVVVFALSLLHETAWATQNPRNITLGIPTSGTVTQTFLNADDVYGRSPYYDRDGIYRERPEFDFHHAVDISKKNAEVHASAGGTVVFAGLDGTTTTLYGYAVGIYHGEVWIDGRQKHLYTYSSHMGNKEGKGESYITVEAGVVVSAGQPIGKQGNAGATRASKGGDGTHLDWEVRVSDLSPEQIENGQWTSSHRSSMIAVDPEFFTGQQLTYRLAVIPGPFDNSAVAALPRLAAGTYHKQANSNAVYLATADGRLWPVVSSEVLFALTGKRDYTMVVNHPANSLDKYIRGPIVGQNGTLYKDKRGGPDYSAVYLVTIDEAKPAGSQVILGVMRPIKSMQVFNVAQFQRNDILPVPEALLNQYIRGGLFTLDDVPVYYQDASPTALAYLSDQISLAKAEDEVSLVQLAAYVDAGRVLGEQVGPTDNTTPTNGGGGNGTTVLYPEIKVDVTSVDCGEAEVGERVSKDFWIKNPGKGVLEVMLDFVPNLPQFWSEPAPYSQRFSVSPGDSQRVEVFFTPTSTLPITVVLVLGGVDDPRLSITGRGKRSVPRQNITITDTLTNGMIMPPFARIKAGQVLMGAAADDPYIFNMGLERPQMLVYITKDFGLGIYEVTDGFWRAIAGNISMTWNNANNVFLPRLNALAPPGVIYRMPTEAEWELAARDGTHTRWFFGAAPDGLRQYAWANENPDRQAWPEEVGLKLPSPNGLYDIYGNRAEMTNSLGGYESRRYTDPVGLSGCIVRGGSWQDDVGVASSVSRRLFGPNDVDRNVSFRLLREWPLPINTPSGTGSTATVVDTVATITAAADTGITVKTVTTNSAYGSLGLSFTHDGGSGDNRVLVVAVFTKKPENCNSGVDAPAAVTFNGVSLVLTTQTPAYDDCQMQVVIYHVANPAAGINTVAVEGIDRDTAVMATALTVSGVDTTAPIGGATESGFCNGNCADKPVNIITTKPNSMLLAAAGDFPPGGLTAGEGQTQQSRVEQKAGRWTLVQGTSTKMTTAAGSYGMKWTSNGGRLYVAAIELLPRTAAVVDTITTVPAAADTARPDTAATHVAVVDTATADTASTAKTAADTVKAVVDTTAGHTAKSDTAAVAADTTVIVKADTVTVQRGDINHSGNGPTAFDAVLILRFIVGLERENAQAAPPDTRDFSPATADVSGEGKVTALDAALILQFDAGKITAFPAPSAKPTVWGERIITVADPQYVEGIVTVRIGLSDLSAVLSAELSLTYDPALFMVVKVAPASGLAGWQAASSAQAGLLKVALAGARGGTGADDFLLVELRPLTGADITSAPLTIKNAVINDGMIPAATDGALQARVRLWSFPNPFNSETIIRYSLPADGTVHLAVYSLIGKEMAVLVSGARKAGNYSVRFKPDNLPSGIYFIRLTAGGAVQTRKMLLLK
jgi:formylglycine-generating enzyme required for sulfatase activity/murein DD-endopeptidase MepM/ murein hydrolase activator NlpD